VYEAGQAGGVPFIAMRYVSGGDVRGLVRRQGPLPPGRAAAIISPVAAALDAAHSVGLVHRDVKPGNMLIDVREGRPDHVYLSDFGIVKGAVSSVALTGTGFIGTAAYSAPEQIQGQVVDGRTDQYALACVTYELLTGTVPFERDQDAAMLLAHLSAPPPSLVARRPDLPGAVEQVLATAMAKLPEERYESCGAFAGALREALGLLAYDRDPAPGTAADATVIGPARAQSGAPAPERTPRGARARMTRQSGDQPTVRVPAAGDRDDGSPAAPPPRLDRGRAGRRARGGGGPAGADGHREPVHGRRVRPVLRRSRHDGRAARRPAVRSIGAGSVAG
jgi:serine/threonine-protein kinase